MNTEALHCAKPECAAFGVPRRSRGRTCLSAPLRLPMAEPGGQACLTTL